MRRESPSGWRQWLLAGLGMVFVPKCLLCLLTYVAVMAGPELCGTAETGFPLLPALGLAVGGASLAGMVCVARRRQ